ncbi:MAG: HNH endonuclease [Chloroflexota bacterium]|nr:HNH endonuclease [Chloroflexota bacterium]
MPNPTLTPGDVIAGVTPAQVCTPGYARSVRFVPASEKIRVYAEYGVSAHAYGAYEVDHLVPLELGGSNDIKNLWPQPAVPVPGFHEKDDLELRLHDLVCRGRLDLHAAQRAIAGDWLAAYRRYIGNAATP